MTARFQLNAFTLGVVNIVVSDGDIVGKVSRRPNIKAFSVGGFLEQAAIVDVVTLKQDIMTVVSYPHNLATSVMDSIVPYRNVVRAITNINALVDIRDVETFDCEVRHIVNRPA